MCSLLCSQLAIEKTLIALQEAGQAQKECLVLWLGRRENSRIEVCQVFLPPHRASLDMFYLPRESMLKVMQHLRMNRLMIAAQVHSHPHNAFHSSADDTWAIVRHVGAISIVLPDFALRTTVLSFSQDAAIFTLSSGNKWCEGSKDLMEII